MTDTQGPAPSWNGKPVGAATTEPDWAALAESYSQSSKRRRQLRGVAACAAAVAAVGGIVITAVQVTGSGQPSGHGAGFTGVGLDGVSGQVGSTAPGTEHGPSASPSGSAPAGPSASAGAPSSAAPSASTATRSAAPTGSTTRPAAPTTGGPTTGGPAASTTAPAPSAPAQTPGAGPTTKGAPTPTPSPSPVATNPYSPGQVCGSGYGVIDSHGLGEATIYLLYNNATGVDCVVTLAAHPNGAVPMNATLAVQGGASTSNPGNFVDYAGPVTEHAPHICVSWGGSYRGTSWTSGWSHCG
ncbi:hypothetical protein [Kitasatospora azatica]|uniref:hypothetical protein n=1 Tax=Kitasatospora azatica TaxID=58347 RepID=UPI0018DB9544|nr:hypothetical protein [Kitasatospora azatica]